MDPLSAGASVLAFIGILNSLQSIYNTLSSVNDGPESLRQAANNVIQLRSIVQKLQAQQSRIDPESQIQLKHCADDVKAIATKLDALQVSPSEKRAGRIWKRIKTALNEKDLDRMSKVIHDHSTALSLRLIVQQRDIVVECRDQILFLKSNLAPGQEQHAATCSSRAEASGTQSNGAAPAIQSHIDAMMRILLQLQAQIPSRPVDHRAVVDLTHVGDGEAELVAHGEEEESDAVSSELLQTINELCMLIGVDERTIPSDDAEDIIEKLEKLLSCTKSNHFAKLEAGLAKDIGRMACHLRSSARLSLNQGDRKNANHVGVGFIHRRNRQQVLDAGTGQLIISTRRLGYQSKGPAVRRSDTDNQITRDEDAEDLATTFTFFPSKASTQRKMLKVSTHHTNQPTRGVSLSIPNICVNLVRPLDSPVFRLVTTGDLDGLLRLLAAGDASLRDHDEHGRSLLTYSVWQPEVCKFLVKHGLDVNHIAPPMLDPEDLSLQFHHPRATSSAVRPRSSILLMLQELRPHPDESVVVHRYHMPGSSEGPIEQCRQILLEAGADPMLQVRDWIFSDTPFYAIMRGGDLLSMRTFFDYGSPFINIDSRDTSIEGGNQTALLIHCGGSFTKRSIEFLLRRGANVNAEDPNGQSCLHIVSRNRQMLRYRFDDVLDAMTLLIRSGANVYWKDHEGRSVSELAYQGQTDQYGRYNLGSSYGDIWDKVLATCGYQVSDFRQGYPRTARYAKHYHRSKFVRMWQGQHHLCPYWDEDKATYGRDPYGYTKVDHGGGSDSDEDSEDSMLDVDTEDGESIQEESPEDGGTDLTGEDRKMGDTSLLENEGNEMEDMRSTGSSEGSYMGSQTHANEDMDLEYGMQSRSGPEPGNTGTTTEAYEPVGESSHTHPFTATSPRPLDTQTRRQWYHAHVSEELLDNPWD
ncbi:hypothetical protein B0T19DRAFT_201627 [Cercophora scortea]|uniref:Fungal N-terminal domain-containing protein n=1 Tax=Cercophora scortea TaxID=314031 RepID=A0AAE0IE19_9PEZI|nr:hypothetical protein B0T19DRAFT_201627 [Cercophora scortea]